MNMIEFLKNNRLLDYYKIISILRPILARVNMGLDFVSGQYGCLFSRCRKYVINSLIHGHFHIEPVIFPGCENMDSLLPVILVIQKCLYLNEVCNKH
jgi:hypothetical protein